MYIFLISGQLVKRLKCSPEGDTVAIPAQIEGLV